METQIVGSRRLSGSDAREINGEFERIRDAAGQLTPSTVVTAARSPRSPLHRHFTWNDRRAGAKFRLQQAAELIRSVRVVIRADPDDRPRTIRAHVSVVTAHGREYVPAVHALSIEAYREQLLADALRELAAFKSKYRQLEALAAVFVAIEVVATRPKRKRAA